MFGGSWVSKDGIKPDIAKLEAIAKWPAPKNLLDLIRFLGLTGYFWSLIQDYSCIAAPLMDLQCNLELPQPVQCKEQKLRQFLQDHDLVPYWTAKYTKAFTQLKHILLEEPTLCTPKFDSIPFVLITDTSKDGFGVVLTQHFTTTLPDGEIKTNVHQSGMCLNKPPPQKNATNHMTSNLLH